MCLLLGLVGHTDLCALQQKNNPRLVSLTKCYDEADSTPAICLDGSTRGGRSITLLGSALCIGTISEIEYGIRFENTGNLVTGCGGNSNQFDRMGVIEDSVWDYQKIKLELLTDSSEVNGIQRLCRRFRRKYDNDQCCDLAEANLIVYHIQISDTEIFLVDNGYIPIVVCGSSQWYLYTYMDIYDDISCAKMEFAFRLNGRYYVRVQVTCCGGCDVAPSYEFIELTTSPEIHR